MGLPLSGVQEILGREQLRGAEIAVRKIDAEGGVLGRNFELAVRDGAANPARAVAGVNDLAGSGANLMLGAVSTGVALAVKPVLAGLNSVFIATSASADELTQKDFEPNFSRVIDPYGVRSVAQSIFMLDTFPTVTHWVGVIADATFGHAGWESFTSGVTAAFNKAGKSIRFDSQFLFKFGAPDFRNQVAALQDSTAKVYMSLQMELT